jgi:hypothetical protein
LKHLLTTLFVKLASIGERQLGAVAILLRADPPTGKPE